MNTMMLKKLWYCLIVGILVFNLAGCEAFVRKFRRKPKKEPPKEEMVLNPEEYTAISLPAEDAYQQYFLFLKSWQDELIVSLSLSSMNHKKQISCIKESIKYLENLRPLCKGPTQKKLEGILNDARELRDRIARDVYGSRLQVHRQLAERLKRNILKDLSFKKMKEDLVITKE